jgi:hypothetical protein
MVLSMVIATEREGTVMRWNIDLVVCAPSVACSPLRALAAEKISALGSQAERPCSDLAQPTIER